MSDPNNVYPLIIDCGDKYGKIELNSSRDVLDFLKTTVPKIADENTLMRRQIESLRAQIPVKQSSVSLNPNSVAIVRRKNDRAVPGKTGELWDEDQIKCIDNQAFFELQFPRGRYVTGFVGTLTVSTGDIPTLRHDLNWHDFFMDVKEDKFWRGRVVIQRRTEDKKYNIRSQGLNEYVAG